MGKDKAKVKDKTKDKAKDEGSDLGKEILSYCGKCKMPQAHIIVSLLKKGGADKCECKTCKAKHKYRDPDKPPKPRAPSKRAAKKEGVPIEVLWAEAVSSAKGPSKPYEMSAEFSTGDLIDHPTFGQGVVEECIDSNKMKVVFESAEKLLAQNR